MRTLFNLTILCTLLIACKSTQINLKPDSQAQEKIDLMDFRKNSATSLSEAIDEGIKSDKLIFVDIYADWCTPCQLMDETVFSDSDFTTYMKHNFINYKVNGEKDNGPDLNIIYNVKSYPTLLVLDHKGRVLARNVGALYQRGLRELADKAISLSKEDK